MVSETEVNAREKLVKKTLVFWLSLENRAVQKYKQRCAILSTSVINILVQKEVFDFASDFLNIFHKNNFFGISKDKSKNKPTFWLVYSSIRTFETIFFDLNSRKLDRNAQTLDAYWEVSCEIF